MMANPIKTLELHYRIVQFLIMLDIWQGSSKWSFNILNNTLGGRGQCTHTISPLKYLACVDWGWPSNMVSWSSNYAQKRQTALCLTMVDSDENFVPSKSKKSRWKNVLVLVVYLNCSIVNWAPPHKKTSLQLIRTRLWKNLFVFSIP